MSNTLFGCYRFTHLPCGIHCESDIFQIIIGYVIEFIQRAWKVPDDMIVRSSDKEHYMRLKLVFDRIKQHVQSNQMCFSHNWPDLLRQKVTSEELKPTLPKQKELWKCPIIIKKVLQYFLSMSNYLCWFIPNYSKITASLSTLLPNCVERSVHLLHWKSLIIWRTCSQTNPNNNFIIPHFQQKSQLTPKRSLGVTLKQKSQPIP